ncbi:MAG: lamin tail domain-containing protein, partial [Verrucomicrobiia bacterium]
MDLSGYYLTDTPSNPTQFKIPNGCVIPPKGFLLVWADNKPTTTNLVAPAELHVNFALSRNGEAIGLYAPDGSVVDLVTFGPQTADVSEGRYPDGSSNIRQLQQPTPGTTNSAPVAGANLPPVVEPVSDKVAVVGQQLRFTVVASDPDQPLQQLRYEILSGVPGAVIDPATGEFSWTPTTNNIGTNAFVVRVVDNGEPPLDATVSFKVVVNLT